MFCNKFHAVTKCSQMHQNTTKRTETLVSGPMGWIGCIRCEKSHRDFVARTFVWIEPVQYVLQQVSCNYKTIPNEPKDNKTDRIISLGSNGVDLVRSLRKILMSLRGTNFCINCTISPRFAPSFMQLRNDPKCTKILWNAPKHEFRVQWGRSCAFVTKITMRLRGTNLCINCTSSVCFATSFMQLRNDPKCTQTQWNTSKHEFRVQWGRSGAFVVKNYNVTSWHELMY